MEAIERIGETVTVRLQLDEVRILNNALNEVLHGPEAIEEWEFHTRVGALRGEAKALLSEVGQLLD